MIGDIEEEVDENEDEGSYLDRMSEYRPVETL